MNFELLTSKKNKPMLKDLNDYMYWNFGISRGRRTYWRCIHYRVGWDGTENTKCPGEICQHLSLLKDFLKEFAVERGYDEVNPSLWIGACAKDIPTQSNSFDCGAFVCKFADCLYRQDQMKFSQKDMSVGKINQSLGTKCIRHYSNWHNMRFKPISCLERWRNLNQIFECCPCSKARMSSSSRSCASSSLKTIPADVKVFDRKTKQMQRDRSAMKEDFDVFRYVRDEFGARVADRVYDLTGYNAVCLDLGCGAGHIGPHLAKDNIGLLMQCDMSQKMVERSLGAPADELPTLRVIADEELVPFRPSSVDLIFSSLSAHWINDLPGWFQRCLNVLQPDGCLIGAVLAGETLHELRVSLQLAEMERLGGMGAHISPYVESHDISSLMNRAGFKLITVDVDEIEVGYPNMFALMCDLQGMAESSANMRRSAKLSREVLVAADSIYKSLYAKDDRYSATFQVINFIGWKPGPTMPKPAKRGSQTVSFKDLSKLVEFGPDGTRWGTYAKLINSIIANESCLKEAIWNAGIQDNRVLKRQSDDIRLLLCSDEEFWPALKQISKVITPLAEAIRKIEGNEVNSRSAYKTIKDAFAEAKRGVNESEFEFGNDMMESLQSRSFIPHLSTHTSNQLVKHSLFTKFCPLSVFLLSERMASNGSTPSKVHTPLVPVDRWNYSGDNLLRDPVASVDSEVHEIMKNEKKRQRRGLQLIASENFTSKAVYDALSSSMSNKYSEGYPGARYYGGNEFIDQMERLCQERALKVFGLDPEKWGVNVQSLSGSPANFAVFTAIVEPHGRIMGLDLPDGGHLTHGFYTATRRVSATSIFFESMPYKIDPETGLIDYQQLEQNAMLFRPKIIVAGISCYMRWLDYPKFRAIADKCGAYVMADMAHIAGLVAAGVGPSPFEYADIVTTTTHKTLRGPRGALIFYRKGVRSVNTKGESIMYDLGSKIDSAVFPGLQAVALKQCLTNQFVEYGHQVVKNAQALAQGLLQKGYCLTSGGTDNHLLLVDLRPNGLDGSRIETVLDMAQIVCNKNTCPGDKSAFRPGGVRLGAAGLTSRGFKENDFVKVADYIHQAIEIYRKHESKCGKTVKEFKEFCEKDEAFRGDLKKLADEIDHFAAQFDLPGNEEF
uniref:Serine hydroxymethyltransferase n=1 Tax=Ditylenchus dipsaci TaxID=166011 RepID=A0A915EB70_9BILA